MSIMAGIVARRQNVTVPEELSSVFLGGLSRLATDRPYVHRQPGVLLSKLDLGFYGHPGHSVRPGGSALMVVGEPLVTDTANGRCSGRHSDMERLHDSFEQRDWGVLKQAHGLFAAAYYDPSDRLLAIATDKLGLRHLYYWNNDDYFVFSTTLRLLEALDLVPKRMDVRALVETAGLGAPLGDRSPYYDISTLTAGQMIIIAAGDVRSNRYWHWDNIRVSDKAEPELVGDVHNAFCRAVGDRLGTDTTTVAFLSGGLDSRSIVAAVRELGADVHTINCSIPGTQDRVYSAAFAQEIGSFHYEIPIAVFDPEFFSTIRDQWETCPERLRHPPSRPQLLWSGNDGCVSLGHLWLDEELVDLMRQGHTDAAVARLFRSRGIGLSLRLFKARVAERCRELLHQGFREEIDRFHCEDPARNLWLVLALNNARKVLRAYAEDIDQYRFDFQLPYFDDRFLTSILAIPIDLCLRHRLYDKWIRRFSPAVTAVPWQTYAGHVSCPIQWEDPPLDQWEASYRQTDLRQRASLLRRLRLMRIRDVPGGLVRRSVLSAARVAYQLNFKDCTSILEPALLYHRYSRPSGGEFVLPEITSR